MRNDKEESVYPTHGAFSVLLAGLLYLALATATIILTTDRRAIAPVWPANAVLLAMLLVERRPRWGAILGIGFVANLLANFMTRGTLTGPILYGSLNILEVTTAAIALRRSGDASAPIGDPRDLLRFIGWAGLIAPVVSGLGGAATAYLLFGQGFQHSFVTWYAADALGLLIVTPFLMAILNGEYRDCFHEKSIGERIEVAVLQGVVAAIACLVFFATTKPLLFVLFPPVMLISFRTGRLGTQAAVLLIAAIGTVATLAGIGPIVRLATTPAQQPLYLQLFLAVLLFTCLPATAGITARNRRAMSLSEQQRALMRERQELAVRAATDPLTGLLNRRGFAEAAERTIADPTSSPIWLIAIDVDYFKQINDRYGHQAGDDALRWIASVLRNALRHDDILARLGGDEFVALLPVRPESEVRAICDRLVASIGAGPRIIRNDLVTLSISCGAARAASDMSVDSLVAAADQALYDAKAAGRNRSLVLAA